MTHPAESRYIAVYERVSQGDEGDDVEKVLRRHRAGKTAFLKRHYAGRKVLFFDEGIFSLTDEERGKERPEFTRMMSLVAEGAIEAIVAENTERIFRGGTEQELFIQQLLIDGDCWIHCINGQDWDPRTLEGELTGGIINRFNAFYKKLTQKKIQLAKDYNVEHGLHNGGTKRGVVKIRSTEVAGGSGLEYRWDDDPTLPAELRGSEAAALDSAGDVLLKTRSLSKAARELAKFGVVAGHGGPLDNQLTARWLTHPFLLGLREEADPDGPHWLNRIMTREDGTPFEYRNLGARWSREKWEQARRIARSSATPSEPRNGRPLAALASLLRCGDCGYAMALHRSSNGNAYRCAQKYLPGGGDCGGMSIGEIALTRLVIAEVSALATPGSLAFLVEEGRRREEGVDVRQQALRDQILAIENRLESLHVKVVMGDLDEDDYAAATRVAKETLVGLRDELYVPSVLPDFSELLPVVDHLANYLTVAWRGGDTDVVRGVLSTFIDHIEVARPGKPGWDPSRAMISWQSWVEELRPWLESERSGE